MLPSVEALQPRHALGGWTDSGAINALTADWRMLCLAAGGSYLKWRVVADFGGNGRRENPLCGSIALP